jgi:hypothetical protein
MADPADSDTVTLHCSVTAVAEEFPPTDVGQPTVPCSKSVGEPGFWEGMIPMWGSGRAAVNDFQNGRWGWGLVNTALAVSDVFLVKSLVTAGGKLLVKTAGKEAVELGEKQLAKQAEKEVAEQAGKKTIPKTYERPSGYRKGVREEAWERAKGPDGKVRDPGTGREMKFDEPWDMGHKPGYEFRKHQQSASERGIDRKQFLDEHNKPEHYRPELPASNRSHKGELKGDDYFGP